MVYIYCNRNSTQLYNTSISQPVVKAIDENKTYEQPGNTVRFYTAVNIAEYAQLTTGMFARATCAYDAGKLLDQCCE